MQIKTFQLGPPQGKCQQWPQRVGMVGLLVSVASPDSAYRIRLQIGLKNIARVLEDVFTELPQRSAQQPRKRIIESPFWRIPDLLRRSLAAKRFSQKRLGRSP